VSAPPGPWTSDAITGWVRDANGREIFRPMGVSTQLLALLLAAPHLAEALRRITYMRDAHPKGRIAADLEIAINAGRTALEKAGL
jgi:hypothetical protein